jgi:predicted transcriptional regulator
MLPASPTPAYAHPHTPPPDPEQLRRLVAAVAQHSVRGRGLRIGPENSGEGWESVEVLLEEEACFAVRTRREILAFDADTEHAVAGLRKLASGLRRRGMAYVHLRSGGPGREHLFVRVGSPHLRESLRSEALRHRIDVRDTSPIRPPGVRHRTGARPELIAPASWDEAGCALEPAAATRALHLSPRLWGLIRDGDLEGRYRRDDGSSDGSAVVMGICHLARTEGVDAQTLFDLLRHPDHRGGEALRARSHRRGRYDARWWFHHTWRKSSSSCGRRGSVGDVAVVAELEEDLARFLTQPRAGQRGNSETAVYTAMVRVAQRERSRQAPMSVRVLAEISGKDVKTVRSALARLAATKLVQMVDPAHLDRAATWELARVLPTGPVGGIGGSESVGTLRVDPGHDGFAHGALGTGAWRVLNALDDETVQDARQLAEVLGMHPGSVRRHLQRMASTGLIEEGEGGWRRAALAEPETTCLLELVAERRGTAGRRARRHRAFEVERQRLREVLTGNDEMLRRRMELALSRGARRYYAGIIAGKRAA